MAVQRLFPKAQVTIGPWCALIRLLSPSAFLNLLHRSESPRPASLPSSRIENGFYYDFDYETPFSDKDLKRIQKEMGKIVAADLPLRREEVTREEARARITALGEPYKLEILDGIASEPITLYHVGDAWWDLCAGPHVASTGCLNPAALELESVAGAYWRGDEKRAQLQRIYGTAWESADQLAAYKARAEAAKARDHRTLGRELGLFSIQEAAGGGLVFWHPAGGRVRHALESYWREAHLAAGYDLVYSPHVAKLDLWRTSGHLDFYRESMFDPIVVEGDEYQLKPMNCPGHVLMFKDGYFSYRDLPLRWAELGTARGCAGGGADASLSLSRSHPTNPSPHLCVCSVLPRRRCTVTSAAARCTACSGCVGSPRTTPTSSAWSTRSRPRLAPCWTSPSARSPPSASTATS